MSGLGKRVAAVPTAGQWIGNAVSKADLLEALWSAASLCNAESCDDDDETIASVLRHLPGGATKKASRALAKMRKLHREVAP